METRIMAKLAGIKEVRMLRTVREWEFGSVEGGTMDRIQEKATSPLVWRSV